MLAVVYNFKSLLWHWESYHIVVVPCYTGSSLTCDIACNGLKDITGICVEWKWSISLISLYGLCVYVVMTPSAAASQMAVKIDLDVFLVLLAIFWHSAFCAIMKPTCSTAHTKCHKSSLLDRKLVNRLTLCWHRIVHTVTTSSLSESHTGNDDTGNVGQLPYLPCCEENYKSDLFSLELLFNYTTDHCSSICSTLKWINAGFLSVESNVGIMFKHFKAVKCWSNLSCW